MPAQRSACLNAASSASASKSLHDQPKSPNAFILFRSYFLAHPALIPPHIHLQKDVSRYVAWVWKELPDSERQKWFLKAREEKERREAGATAQTSHTHMSNVSSSNAHGFNPIAPFQPVTFTRKVPGLDDITDADLQALLEGCMDDMRC